MKITRKHILILITTLAIAGGVGVFAFQKKEGPRVRTERLSRGPLVQTVLTSGRVRHQRGADLGASSHSTIAEVAVTEGQTVSEGDLLIRFADESARAALAEAEALRADALARLRRTRGVGRRLADQSLEQAQLAADQAQSDLARQEQLFSAGAVTEAELERARRQARTTESRRVSATLERTQVASRGSDIAIGRAALAQAQARVSAATATLQQTQLRAPFDGVVLELHAEVGEVVTPGHALVHFVDSGPLTLVAEPGESVLSLIALEQDVAIRLDAFPERDFEGQISFIAQSVNAQRGTVEVHVSLPEFEGFRSDMTATAEIEVDRRQETLIAAPELVRDRTTSPWLMIVEDGRAARLEVELGIEGQDAIEILPKEGESVPSIELEVIPLGERVELDRPVRVRR